MVMTGRTGGDLAASVQGTGCGAATPTMVAGAPAVAGGAAAVPADSKAANGRVGAPRARGDDCASSGAAGAAIP
jgi:hypothetical protein